MGKNVAIIAVIILILALGGWYFLFDGDELVEEEEEVVSEEEGEDPDPEAKEDPYREAEEVVPMGDRNVALNEDFEKVLSEVFEEEPKLVSTGDISALLYVTPRVITEKDVLLIEDLLEEEGYETVGTSTEPGEYELDIAVEEEILEEKYDGDMGGNMYVRIFTAEEGENMQRIEVVFL